MSSLSQDPPQELKNDAHLDQTLRPSSWDEYIGQESIKNNLHILISAAKERSTRPEHILFYGPPGLGKTTLAHLIAHELGGALRATSGPAIERVGDLAALLTNLNPGDILFIDEIHRLSHAIEEVLYPAMESSSLNIIIGKGPSARTLDLPLPPFTLIAATTRVADLSAPLRSRFQAACFASSFTARTTSRTRAALGKNLGVRHRGRRRARDSQALARNAAHRQLPLKTRARLGAS